MAGANQKVDRQSVTQRYLDRMRNPPEYVDDELPTKTVHLINRAQQGTIIDSNSGALNMGSVYFSGSHYDDAPGSFSLRITRRHAAVGSMDTAVGDVWWKLHHSRLGTVDMLPFQGGVVHSHLERGDRLAPVYSFGPGTITHYMQSLAGTARVSASMEGIF